MNVKILYKINVFYCIKKHSGLIILKFMLIMKIIYEKYKENGKYLKN